MAKLLLEDGREFSGKILGNKKKVFGEIVFNTSMTGYQEILTDPSYAGQIISMTYPEIGNYGCSSQDYESRTSFAKGFVIKNYSPIVSSYRAEESLEDFLNKHELTAIYDLDTRALTKHLRDKGSMRAVISNGDEDSEILRLEVLKSPSMTGLDLVSGITCREAYFIPAKKFSDYNPTVIALDFGIKTNILNRLSETGFNIQVLPAQSTYKEIMEYNPDAVFLSNGPGDPAAVFYAIDTVRELLDRFSKPIFGICLGHQILALATGASTFKLKFGHRGANQPIKNLATGKIEIASHNHGFAVSFDALPENIEITHLNINDNTIAGLRLKNRKNVFSVQYHPESSPGPHDSDYLFEEFLSFCRLATSY
jgi:carbamoyl-phosphate synthase small subunit